MEEKINLYETDPEFMQRHNAFTHGEVVNEAGQTLDEKTRYLSIPAALMGCPGVDEYKEILSKALDGKVTPVEAKEVAYQGGDYLGMG